MQANEDKIQHAINRILIPLKNHLEKHFEEKLALVAQSVQALKLLLFSKDFNKLCVCCCRNCCNGNRPEPED